MQETVRVACAQVEPVILDRDATIEKLARFTAEAAQNGAQLVVFPETFIPAYPSSRWARALAGWADPCAKEAFALLRRESLEVPSNAERRLGAIAREHSVWLVTPLGRLGGLICWENYMPLARFSLYESGVEIYIASTADDGDAWQATLVHIARESRAFVVAPSHYQRAASYPDDFPLRDLLDGDDLLGRGGSAILGPDGNYLAGPLYGAEGVLYAHLEANRLYEERQRFDPAGHYNRPELLRFELRK